MSNKTHLQRACLRITDYMTDLIEAVSQIENSPEDEAAYDLMRCIRSIALEMDKARVAGSDDHGNDALNAYEAVANAIREAFPVPDPSEAALRKAVDALLASLKKEE